MVYIPVILQLRFINRLDHILFSSSAISSLGFPFLRTCPLFIIAISEHRLRTSSTRCVDRITITSLLMSFSKELKRLRSSGSSPAVGSSTIIIFGFPNKACATPNLCRIPPEKVCTSFMKSERLTFSNRFRICFCVLYDC